MSTKQRVDVRYSDPESGSIIEVRDAIVQMESNPTAPGATELDETVIQTAVRSVILDAPGAHDISLSPSLSNGRIHDVFINLRDGADIVRVDDTYSANGAIQDVVINGTDDPTTTADDKTLVLEASLDGARDARFTYNAEDGSFIYTNTEGSVERMTLGDAINNFRLTVYDRGDWIYYVEDISREELLERAQTSPTIYVRDLLQNSERVQNP